MSNPSRGVRYSYVEEIPSTPWCIQGTVYENVTDAKFAAMKVYANATTNTSVIVKQVVGGFGLFWWRRG